LRVWAAAVFFGQEKEYQAVLLQDSGLKRTSLAFSAISAFSAVKRFWRKTENGKRVIVFSGAKGNEMSVLQICEQAPASVSVESTVAEAIRQMIDAYAGAVAIIDSERVVAGIFTERDVLARVALSGRDPATTPVRDVMTTPVELATSATTEAEALSVMLERHYRHLPVVDDHGRLLGMLSIRHVLEARIDELVHQLRAAREK
jgi:CBS domain-containing protein